MGDYIPIEVQEKLEEAVELWAEKYLPGRPAMLGSAMFYTLEAAMTKKTKEIIETFPIRRNDL